MKQDSAAERATGDQGAAAPEAAADEAGEGRADSDEKAGGGEKTEADAAKTQVIRTASLSVEVESVPKALAKARSAALGAGGVIEDETTERVDDSRVASNVVLRVPEAEYDSVLAELAGTGKLLSRTANAKDVTEQVVDVNSRIATQRASVNRVRKLMDQARDITDVVALESQLNTRQAELESLLAKQASLADRTAMATITLDLSQETKEDKGEGDDDPGFLDALGGGWDAFVSVLRWIVVVLAAILPFVVALAVLFLLWRLFGVRLPGLRGRTPGREPANAPAPAPAAPAPARSPDEGKRD